MPAKKSLEKTLRECARVLSVFGPFNAMTLVQMPTELALELFPDGLAEAARPDVVEAVEGELDELRGRGAAVDGALAATAVAMAYELQDPYNSATSKSMCAKALSEAMRELRSLSPAKPEEDEVERARKRRADRLAGKPAAGSASSS